MPIKFRTKDTQAIAAYLATIKEKREFFPEKLYGEVEERFVQRYFRRNEGTTDYATIPEVTLTGDFEISFLALFSELSNTMLFSGGTGTEGFELFFDSVGRLSLRYEGGHPGGVTAAIPLNELTRISVVRVGSTVSILINGTVGLSNTISGPVKFSVICGRVESTFFYLAGVMANLKIWDNGTLIRDYPLDEPKGTDIIVNRATALGEELAIGLETPDANTSSLLYSYVDGTVSITETVGGSAYPRVVFNDRVEDGVAHIVTVTIDATNSSVDGFIGIGDVSDTTEERVKVLAGVVKQDTEILLPSGGADIRFYLNSVNPLVGDTITFSNISIRRADGYGTIVNGNADDWGLFDRQANGDWLGQELSTMSSTPPLGDDSDPEFITLTGSIILGRSFRLGANFSNSGSSAAGCGWSTSRGVPTATPFRSSSWVVGDFVGGDFVPTSSGIQQLFGRGGPGVASYDNVSVKEVLQVP